MFSEALAGLAGTAPDFDETGDTRSVPPVCSAWFSFTTENGDELASGELKGEIPARLTVDLLFKLRVSRMICETIKVFPAK